MNKTLLFCGKSHAGKSTTAAIMKTLGAEVLTEDISIIEINKTPKLISGPNYIKLSPAAAKILQNEELSVIEKQDKRSFYKFNSRTKLNRENIDKCYINVWAKQSSIKKLNNKDILTNLLKYSFNSKSDDNLVKILSFINKVEISQLNIEKDFLKIDSLVRVIGKDLS
ncbi:MAG: hypothetical protein ISP94_04280 [SAR86 cluster bacterium]|nr:hypothetical protein [SAR86 cluster bacterium]